MGLPRCCRRNKTKKGLTCKTCRKRSSIPHAAYMPHIAQCNTRPSVLRRFLLARRGGQGRGLCNCKEEQQQKLASLTSCSRVMLVYLFNLNHFVIFIYRQPLPHPNYTAAVTASRATAVDCSFCSGSRPRRLAALRFSTTPSTTPATTHAAALLPTSTRFV